MIALEKHLIENGWKKYRAVYSKSAKKWFLELEKPGKHVISTMVNIDYRYLKTETDEIPDFNSPQIITGLNQIGKPITLIYPRLKSWLNDDIVNRRLAIGDFEQILKEILQ